MVDEESDEQSTTPRPPGTEYVRYGWKCCRPSFLQSCLSPGWILASCCCYVFVQQFIVTGISNVVVSSVEKRFFLRSSEAGAVLSCFEVGNLFLTIIVSYFGHRHKAKWLGSGALVFALGCFVFVLPQFITEKYDPIVSKSTDVCRNISNTTAKSFTTEEDLLCRQSHWYLVFLLVAGQVIIGAGASPLFSLGPSYLDENVTQKNSGLFISLYYSIAALGAGTGFIVGGYFLVIYVDFSQVSQMMFIIYKTLVS